MQEVKANSTYTKGGSGQGQGLCGFALEVSSQVLTQSYDTDIVKAVIGWVSVHMVDC